MSSLIAQSYNSLYVKEEKILLSYLVISLSEDAYKRRRKKRKKAWADCSLFLNSNSYSTYSDPFNCFTQVGRVI